jgi:hypothetical protein
VLSSADGEWQAQSVDPVAAKAVLRAVEQAGVAGLCLEGRIEIGVQEARRHRPELDDEALLALVRALLADEAGNG